MLSQRIYDILKTIKVSADDPRLYKRVFIVASKARKQDFQKVGDNIERVCAEEYEELSRRLDRSNIQESCAVRNVLRTRRLANLLINDKGRLNEARIPRVIELIKKYMYSLGPKRQYDGPRKEQILRVLTSLIEDPQLVRKLRRVSKPFRNLYAEQIIRETLELSPGTSITDAHARRAVLSAWLCYLRQNVGSCFATAPAIIVHNEQPGAFLDDITELLATGQLKRTFGGRQYSVPLSLSWGSGDLKRHLVVPGEAVSGKADLWLSPGLIAAFESVDLIQEDLSLKEKIKSCKKLIMGSFTKTNLTQPYFTITPEDIIRRVLLKQFDLTEEDISEHENRPVGMIHGGLLMQVAGAGGKKQQQCTKFLETLKFAYRAFKSLADNALLKSWEFTVASFAESKAQFTKWNLYSSLGLAPDDQGGIGYCMFEILKRKVDETNRKIQDFQDEYEQVYGQLKYLEGRIRSASTEKEAKWVKVEYQSRRNEFKTLEELRNRTHFKASRFANLFNELVDIYYQLFPRYFQEIYDADIHDVTAGPYDDSPAGFRLLYKHGRSNTSQWTLIYDQHQFIDVLSNFFTVSEQEISSFEELQGLEDDLSEIVTAIVNHVRTSEFLESALYRMAATHKSRLPKNPLEHMDRVEKKPWVYTSGGAMKTLVSSYFGREENPTESDRWMENPMELLVWLVDTMKQLPSSLTEEYVENPEKGMLIHSPTHAFIFKPGLYPFSDLWQSEKYTYTWVRDYVISPMKTFIQRLWLEEDSMRQIVEYLAETLPRDYREGFKQTFSSFSGRLSSVEFRNKLINQILKEPGLRFGKGPIINPDIIDSVLFKLLPYFPGYQLRDRVEKILEKIEPLHVETRETALKVLDELTGRVGSQQLISAQQLQEVCKAVLCLATDSTSTPYDAHLLISRAAQELGFAMPTPVIFADTNWIKDLFALVVSPGTGELELWRVDYTCREGSPMSMWSHWLDGSRPDIKWGVYTRPYEYVALEQVIL